MEALMNKFKFNFKKIIFLCLFLTTANLFGMYSDPTTYIPYVPTSENTRQTDQADSIISILIKNLNIQNNDLEIINKIIALYCEMFPDDSNEAIATKIIEKINYGAKYGITNYTEMLIIMISSAIIKQLEVILNKKIDGENEINLQEIITFYLKAYPHDSYKEIANAIKEHIEKTTKEQHNYFNLTGIIGLIRTNLIVEYREKNEEIEAATIIQRWFRKLQQKKKDQEKEEGKEEEENYFILPMDLRKIETEKIDHNNRKEKQNETFTTPYIQSTPTTHNQKHTNNTTTMEDSIEYQPTEGYPRKDSYMETIVATPKRRNKFVLDELKESIYKTPPSSPRQKYEEDEEDPMTPLFEY